MERKPKLDFIKFWQFLSIKLNQIYFEVLVSSVFLSFLVRFEPQTLRASS